MDYSLLALIGMVVAAMIVSTRLHSRSWPGRPGWQYQRVLSFGFFGLLLLFSGLIGWDLRHSSGWFNGARWVDGPVWSQAAIGAVMVLLAVFWARRVPSRSVTGVIVMLAAASVTMAGQQTPATAVDPPPVGQVITPDGIRLHYEISGKGPTIVVIHGGPGMSSAYLAPDLDVLAAHYRLINYDQRGGGRSTVVTDPAKLTRDHHVEDVDAVRRQFGLDKVVLLGHSWGAAPAAFYAKAHTDHVAAVILLDPIPARSEPWIDQFGANLRRWMDETTSKQVAALAAARRGASDPVAACRAYWAVFIRGYMANPNDTAVLGRMRGDVCNAPPEALANSGAVSSTALGSNGWDWREEFHGTDVPVLIVHGDKDPIPLASAYEWEKAFPRATLVPIGGAGHFPNVEQPQAFLRAIQPFVTAHPPPR